MDEILNRIKIGIVGSRKYTNTLAIKEFIWQLKCRFGDRLVIVSGGQPKGADGYAKHWATYLQVEYVEFPPRHYQWNRYCVKGAFWYNQPYKSQFFFQRNQEVVDYCDKMVFFIPRGTNIQDSRGTYDTFKRTIKKGIKYTILN